MMKILNFFPQVYTVGPDYAHAEARKSPALDGKVERDRDGKEIRYPVILSNAEKLISRKVCLAFKQAVCGFDLLRANGEYSPFKLHPVINKRELRKNLIFVLNITHVWSSIETKTNVKFILKLLKTFASIKQLLTVLLPILR